MIVDKNCGRNLLKMLEWINFRGCIGRKTFFLRMLCMFICLLITGISFVLFPNKVTGCCAIVAFVILVLLMYSTYAKRLRDLGLSGHLCLGILLFNVLTKDYREFNMIVTVIIMCAFCFIKGEKEKY